ncbi:MAG: MoxR family ATPase [Gammaproteobacteria bacterium]|nr:MoxR family ATPase [Gammaproteobacteria bacterium]
MNSFPYYQGSPNQSSSKLPPATQSRAVRPDPATYIPDDDLKAAVNVALMLGRPLLLTGEPGCGKTQLAYHLAWEMKELDEPLRFDTKSTSTARDLFYTYDAVAHFHAAQIRKELKPGEVAKRLSPLPFIKASALGLAILRSKDKTALNKGGLHKDSLFPLLDLGKEEHEAKRENHQPRRSIVLVDEIDKAPSDFPNDILNEIDELYFTIPEFDNLRVDMDSNFRPILIMTSNSEKHFPEAFVRRCVYYDIPFPDKTRIAKIIPNHLGKKTFKGKPALFSDAQAFFLKLREESAGLRKKPGTAELLDWLWVLEWTMKEDKRLREQDEQLVTDSFSSLVKNEADQAAVRNQWTNYK